MKLSVLIPVYNRSIQALLDHLSREVEQDQLQNQIEIVVFDDASIEAELKRNNQHCASQYPWIHYLELEQNLGRSSIRNLLIDQARGQNLLFLDCDVLPDYPNFLGRYLQVLTFGQSVIVGGLSYRQVRDIRPENRFYFRFSQKTDVHPAPIRCQNPWKYVLTSNLVIPTEVARKFRFDEHYVGHGYEDLDWGSRISENGIQIEHIDNPVSHFGLVENRVFIQRMRQSMGNLWRFSLEHPQHFEQTQIARFSKRLRGLPGQWLEGLDKALNWLLSQQNLPFILMFIGFQINKAVLFEIQRRISSAESALPQTP